MATTWAAVLEVDLTNGDLTVTSRQVGSRARSAAPITAKGYFELTYVASSGQSFGVGVANASESGYVGGTANSCGILADGNVFQAGAYITGHSAALATTNIIRLAVDPVAKLLWIAVNGGDWNDWMAGNPATGLNGIDISGIAGDLYAYFEADAGGTTVTANFGASAFAYTAPAGFGNVVQTYTLSAGSASFATTGQDATLLRAKRLIAAGATFTTTGQSATLKKGRTLTADPATFSTIGQPANLKKGYRVAASSASYTTTGQTATLNKGRSLLAASAAYLTAGQPVTFRRTYRLTAEAAAFSTGGADALLKVGEAALTARPLSGRTIVASPLSKPGSTVDRSRLKLLFEETWGGFRRNSPQEPSGIWSTTFPLIQPNGGRTHGTDMQAFGDASVGYPQGHRISNGVLSLRAQQMPAELSATLYGKPYVSAMASTMDSFATPSGDWYFEGYAQAVNGKGLHPCMWFLEKSEGYHAPPEIDVFEIKGADGYYVFSDHSGSDYGAADYVFRNGTAGSWNGFPSPYQMIKYGFLLTRTKMQWFVNDVLAREAEPFDQFFRPMYLLITHLVGTDFSGAPDGTTPFPADMKVGPVRLYAYETGRTFAPVRASRIVTARRR